MKVPPSSPAHTTAASTTNSVLLPSASSSDDFSFYYSFFDTPQPLVDMPPANHKRKKKGVLDFDSRTTAASDDDGGEKNGNKMKMKKKTTTTTKKKVAITKILTSLAMLEEEQKTDEREFEQKSEREIALLESNHREKAQTMLGFYSDVNDYYYSDIDESDTLRTKRTRLAAAAAATTSVVEEKGEIAAATTGEGGGGAQSNNQNQQHQRRLWVKDRSRAWWDRCNHPDFPESEFKSAFRMTKSTFDMICEVLGSAVAKEDTMLRAAIPVRQRVAVCIWRLATGEPLRLVSKRFGLGISTCHKLVLEVCLAIKTVLMPKFLQWPNDPAAVDSIRSRFESTSGITNVIGSMYTTHIPIIAPKISVAAYFNKRHTERNQKTSYSITVQGVVDPDGVFTDVCIGWPGSMADDQVLEKSALYQRAVAGSLNNQWVVGGSGYPLMDWVLVPYAHQNLTWTQHAFNEKIGEVQRIARDAFARLKGRWKCLQKRTEVKLQDLPVVLGACCVLHNVCEINKEGMDPELSFELVDDEMVPENPLRSGDAGRGRDGIAHNLLHRGLAGTTFF